MAAICVRQCTFLHPHGIRPGLYHPEATAFFWNTSANDWRDAHLVMDSAGPDTCTLSTLASGLIIDLGGRASPFNPANGSVDCELRALPPCRGVVAPAPRPCACRAPCLPPPLPSASPVFRAIFRAHFPQNFRTGFRDPLGRTLAEFTLIFQDAGSSPKFDIKVYKDAEDVNMHSCAFERAVCASGRCVVRWTNCKFDGPSCSSTQFDAIQVSFGSSFPPRAVNGPHVDAPHGK